VSEVSWPDVSAVHLDGLDHELRTRTDAYQDWGHHTGGAWPRDQWQAQVDAVRERLDQVELGQVPTPDPVLQALIEPLRLLRAIPHDRRSFVATETLPPLSDIVRVVTDIHADAGDRPESVLGAWFEQLDARRPEHRAALKVALALRCFAALGEDLPVVKQWAHEQGTTTVEERARLHAVDRVPQSLWLVLEVHGDQVLLQDAIGLEERWVPNRAATLVEPGWVASPPRAGDTLTARLFPEGDRWLGTCALSVPGQPQPELVRAWLQLEVVRARLVTQRITLEGLLRRRGHVLARRLHDWAWVRG